MNLWNIAYRSVKQRRLASMLTSISMALGVTLVVAVLTISGVVKTSFETSTSLGYNMVVGAKGGALQLTMNSVFYLSEPIENIPYEYYLEFLPLEQRQAAYENSYKYQAVSQQDELRNVVISTTAATGGLAASITQEILNDHLDQQLEQVLPWKRQGKFSAFTGLVIPLCLGDYFGTFRVIGTTPALFNELKYGPQADRQYTFTEGRNFVTHSDEHGFYEAVVGATVAREMNLTLGSEIQPSHGAQSGEVHATAFTVVGILDSTGTPNDRGVFINMEGFYLMEDHAKPVDQEEDFQGVEVDKTAPNGLTLENREITSMLLLTGNPIFAPSLENTINEANTAQAVFPIKEISILFDSFVDPARDLLLVITILVCLVSAVSILVSIYNTMSERRKEIAILRSLGARRNTVMFIIMIESFILSAFGGILGFVCGHGLITLGSDAIEGRTGISIGFFEFAPPLGMNPETIMGSVSPELMIIPGMILLSVVAGILPAISAYRTDVSQSL